MLNEDSAFFIPSKGFRPLDKALLIYAVIELILVAKFLRSQPVWTFYLLFYSGIIALPVFMRFAPLTNYGRFWQAIRVGYPLVFFLMLYEAIGPQIQMIQHRLFDNQIHSLEAALFGADPAFLLQPYMQIWINEFMSLSYMSYFFLLPTVAIIFIVKKNIRALEQLSFSVSATFFVCYLLFIIYPVAGPRFYLSETYYLPFIGPLLTPALSKIVLHGGLYGGAMPSSHCAVALVIVWILGKEYKWAGIPFGSLFLFLSAATVYGRFHYLSDVIAGIGIGAIMLVITLKIQNNFWQKNQSTYISANAEIAEPEEILSNKTDIEVH